MFINVVCYINFPVRIQSLQVESPNETNNSLAIKDDIHGKDYKIRRYAKKVDKGFVFYKFSRHKVGSSFEVTTIRLKNVANLITTFYL